jgi:hypothetical protein
LLEDDRTSELWAIARPVKLAAAINKKTTPRFVMENPRSDMPRHTLSQLDHVSAQRAACTVI